MAMLNNQRITNAVSTQFRKLTVRFWRRYHELNRRDSKPSSRLNGLSVQADATPLLCSWKLPRGKEPKMKCSLDWFSWENLGKILTGNPWVFLPLNWSGFPVKIFPRKAPKMNCASSWLPKKSVPWVGAGDLDWLLYVSPDPTIKKIGVFSKKKPSKAESGRLVTCRCSFFFAIGDIGPMKRRSRGQCRSWSMWRQAERLKQVVDVAGLVSERSDQEEWGHEELSIS